MLRAYLINYFSSSLFFFFDGFISSVFKNFPPKSPGLFSYFLVLTFPKKQRPLIASFSWESCENYFPATIGNRLSGDVQTKLCFLIGKPRLVLKCELLTQGSGDALGLAKTCSLELHYSWGLQKYFPLSAVGFQLSTLETEKLLMSSGTINMG